eukprot:Awhi_evm1s219
MKFSQAILGLSCVGASLANSINRRADEASASQNLNVHIKLSQECFDKAVEYNQGATDIIGTNQTVDFVSGLNEPHITLYLTDFNTADVPALQEYIDNFVWGEDCEVNLDHGRSTGTGYVFWDPDVLQPPCLAKLAQEIMDGTNGYIVEPTEEAMPSWILGLDEPEKTDKTENYFKYGSPNIGKYYEPHVTYAAVAFGVEGDFDAVADVVGTEPGAAPCSYIVSKIALGQTGESGTVLMGEDLASTDKVGAKYADEVQETEVESPSQNLNIHIKLSEECYEAAVEYNQGATDIIGENQTVDFVSGLHEPHITLYLTDFNTADVPALQEYVDNFVWGEDCEVNLDHGRSTGTGYVFWDPDVLQPPCLAKLAQVIMDGTNEYIVEPTEEAMPSWILGLDEPEKTDKTENYFKYGSPNIGKYYEPHVTYAAVAFGVEGDFDAVAEVVGTEKGSAKCSYTVSKIALGQTGESGTVLKGEDLASTDQVGSAFADPDADTEEIDVEKDAEEEADERDEDYLEDEVAAEN